MLENMEFEKRRKYTIAQLLKDNLALLTVEQENLLKSWVEQCDYIKQVTIKSTNSPVNFQDFFINDKGYSTYEGTLGDSARRVCVLIGDFENYWKPALFSQDQVQIVILQSNGKIYVLVYEPDNTGCLVESVTVIN
jgi:hypothetical protein